MRTHRLTLMVTAAEKERISREAAALGVSASEYVREAAVLLDAGDVVALRKIPSLLPEFNAALERIHTNLAAAAECCERNQQEIARMRTPEYRQEICRSIAEDEIDLDAVASLFGIARPEPSAAEANSPKGATLFERLGNFAWGSSHVSEPRQPWREDNPPATRKPSE